MAHETLVIVPTFMSHPLRYRLFDQLWHDTAVGRVLVVDNGNSFGVPAKKAKTWSKIVVKYPGRNLNWLGACIYGSELAKEMRLPYVAFLNDDVQLSSNFFSGLKTAIDGHKGALLASSQYDGQFCGPARCDTPRRSWRPRNEETEVPFIDGTCMFMPLRTLETVGTLDSTFGAPGWGADADFSYRVRQAGGKVIVTKRSMMWHKGGVTAQKVYGGRDAWQKKGHLQMHADLQRKYGENLKAVFSLTAG